MVAVSHLAIDLGAESGRVVAGAKRDGAITFVELHRFANGGRVSHGHLRWNIAHLLDEIRRGMTKAAEAGFCVTSFAIDTWGVDYGLIDDQGKLLEEPYHYRDPRTDGSLEQIYRHISPEELFALTGIQPWPYNTLMQLVAQARQSPTSFERAQHLLLMPDLLTYLLTGEVRREATIASTSQCYRAGARSVASDLLDRLGIPARLFGDVVPAGTRGGRLLPHFAEATRLFDAIAVLPASHDTASAVSILPRNKTGVCFLSSGTWSLMGTVLDAPVLSESARLFGLTNEVGVAGTTRLLKNIAGLWLLQRCRLAWLEQGTELSYLELEQLARNAPDVGKTFDPDEPSLQLPSNMLCSLAHVCQANGVTCPRDPGGITRLILRSLAAKYAQTLEQLRRVTGLALSSIHVIGGGSKNALLAQFTADACQVPVHTGPVEATALGNLVMQLTTMGETADLAEGFALVAATETLREFWPAKA